VAGHERWQALGHPLGPNALTMDRLMHQRRDGHRIRAVPLAQIDQGIATRRLPDIRGEA
jgi:hypothetical protein